MTGAPMPAGTDTVVPQELVERAGDQVKVPATAKGSNVRLSGEDVRAGAVVIEAGAVLRPQELGVIASLGLPQILVRQGVRVAILSTGDEVAEPGDPRKPGQIYDSNRFALRGLVEQAGGAGGGFGPAPPAAGGRPDRRGALLRPAGKPRGLHADLPPLRPPGALEAGRPPRDFRRAVPRGGDGGDAQESGTAGVQARHSDIRAPR